MIRFTIPIKLESLANKREFWAKKAARAKSQREAGRLFVAMALEQPRHGRTCSYPIQILITRIGRRKLDSDNLAISAKHLRDGIADALEIDDGDESKCIWSYAQRVGKEYAVEVQIG